MQKFMRWFEAIDECRKSNEAWVMATVLETQGSTPREAGAKMLITEASTFDTLGGGRLEFLVIQRARSLIAQGKATQVTEQIPLSAKAGQCCGGKVTVLLESFACSVNQLHIFGAGHVAKALIKIVGELDLSVHWVDSRENEFPQLLPSNVKKYVNSDLLKHIPKMASGALSLVLTHDHALDYKITCALMDRNDCRYIGLIGSKTKSLRFKKRYRSDAFSAASVDSIICPVGLQSIPGKQPMEVAVSIAAQIIQVLHNTAPETTKNDYRWENLLEEHSE